MLRTLVNESDAAVAHLVAEKTYKRPHIWEVAENAERLEGIGSHDRCVALYGALHRCMCGCRVAAVPDALHCHAQQHLLGRAAWLPAIDA